MRSRPRGRAARVLAALALVLRRSCRPPRPASAAGRSQILRVGTDQDLQVLNPCESVTVADFEVFTLNYDLLVDFGQDLEPVPGLRRVLGAQSSRRHVTWTFKIRTGMKWSDGQPATAEDARWTFQFVLDARRPDAATSASATSIRTSRTPASRKVEAPDATTLVVTNTDPSDSDPPDVHPDPAEAHLAKHRLAQIGDP